MLSYIFVVVGDVLRCVVVGMRVCVRVYEYVDIYIHIYICVCVCVCVRACVFKLWSFCFLF